MPGNTCFRRTAQLLTLLLAVVALTACADDDVTLERAVAATPLTAALVAEHAEPEQPEPAPAPEAVVADPAEPVADAPPAAEAVPRALVDTGFAPFATTEQVTLLHPAAQVERVGFHEASHDGARMLAPTAQTAAPMVLESRERGTGSHTAADIVVSPDAEIRSPVTGTVVRAGGYVLYCKHQDDYAVIEPDGRPGWEVKVLHINGVQVEAGQRVEAGVTVLAPGPTVLPFPSQIDDFTGEPSWPHVHVEVVDTSIPDRPAPGGGGGGGGC